jgi:hypothetical protein
MFRKTKILNVVIAFVLLVSAFSVYGLARPNNAKADGIGYPSDPPTPSILFYITDNPDYIDFDEQPWDIFSYRFDEIIVHNFYENDHSSYYYFHSPIECIIGLTSYTIDSNDFLIVDINTKLDEDICNAMYSSFSMLQSTQIMFINNTDEGDMQYYSSATSYKWSAFLDYVDIHINTNLIQWFMANVLFEFYFYETGMTPNDNGYSYIIFDESLSNERTLEILLAILFEVNEPSINFDDLESECLTWFEKLVRILDDGYKLYPVFTNYNGYLLYSMSRYGNTGYNSFDDFLDPHSGEKVAAVGTTWLGDVDIESEIMEIMHYCEMNFYPRNQNYLLIQNGSYLDQGSGYANYIGMDKAAYNYYLYNMLNDFFDEYSLLQYDNWPGRCDVTFKLPFGNDPGAWNIPRYNFYPCDLCLCGNCGCLLAKNCALHCDCGHCCEQYRDENQFDDLI